jgi:glutaredoxin
VPMVELFGTSWCEFTGEMREWLELRGVDFVEYDVDRDRGARARLTAIANERTVPVLVEDGKVVQIGWHGRGCTVA